MENFVPLADDQVGGDDDGLGFVALGEELEGDVALDGQLGAAQFVDSDGVIALELR